MENIVDLCKNEKWDELELYLMDRHPSVMKDLLIRIIKEGTLVDEQLMRLVNVFNGLAGKFNQIDTLYASLHHSSHECFKTEMARPGICSMSEISYRLGKVITSCPRRISEAVAVVSDIFGKEELYAYYYAIRISDSRVIISELEGKCNMLEVRRILKEKYNTDLRDDV